MAIDVDAAQRIANAENEHVANGAWQFRETSVWDCIAVADNEKRGAAGWPAFGQRRGFAYAVNERCFTRIEGVLEGEIVEDGLHDLDGECVYDRVRCGGIKSDR